VPHFDAGAVDPRDACCIAVDVGNQFDRGNGRNIGDTGLRMSKPCFEADLKGSVPIRAIREIRGQTPSALVPIPDPFYHGLRGFHGCRS